MAFSKKTALMVYTFLKLNCWLFSCQLRYISKSLKEIQTYFWNLTFIEGAGRVN
jgi:hypothetical protein